MGNGNVVYTAWKTPAWDGDFFSNSSSGQLNVSNFAASVLTKDAIDKGLIMVYYKTNQLVAQGSTYVLAESISPMDSRDGVAFAFKIPGRTTNLYADYAFANINQFPLRENFFRPYLNYYTFTGQNFTPIPEISDKPKSFYQDLAKTLPQYRIVVAYGSVLGRQAVDFTDYAAVKKAFNLPD